MTIVLQFYPNGEFSQGVDTSSSRPLRCEKKTTQTSLSNAEITYHDLLICKQQTADMGAQIYGKEGTHFADIRGESFTLVESQPNYCVLARHSNNTEGRTIRVDTSIYRLVHLGMLRPLVHQLLQSCEKPKSRKVLLSMTKRMSRNIRNGVYLLEKGKGGKDVLSFLTLTLPNLSTEGLKACCEKWDYMVKRFFDWLRTHLSNKGLELEHVYCTEIQLKRLQQRGEYAPHLHVVFKGRATVRSTWAVHPKEARRAWARCIRAVTDESFDTKALENLQRIKYSAARYLSKYLSKGSNIIPEGSSETPISHLKTQWGGMARVISQGIRKATQRFTTSGPGGHIARCIFDNIDRLVEAGYILYFKQGFIPLDSGGAEGMERGLYVGCGCLSTPTYEGGVLRIMSYLSRQDSLS